MKKLTLLTLLVSINFGLFAQNVEDSSYWRCYFQETSSLDLWDEKSSAAMEVVNAKISNKVIDYHSKNKTQNDTIYNITVVFHVMHLPGTPTGSDENLDSLVIHQTLEDLNKAFRKIPPFSNSNGVDTKINFCLPAIDKTGSASSGILRIPTNDCDSVDSWNSSPLMSLSQWDTSEYLNIYTVKSINDVVGFSSGPISHGQANDGVFISANMLNQTLTRTSLIHEIGHYFGLLHIFSNNCVNLNCLEDGDKICDTPPMTNQSFELFCSSNTCQTDADDTSEVNPFSTDVPDNLRTFMGYGNPLCMDQFTEGQKIRMRSTISVIRHSLHTSNACSDLEVGINTHDLMGKFEVFPNPADSYLRLRFPNIKKGKLKLYNSLGNTVLIREVFNESEVNLNVEHFSKGVYFIQVTEGEYQKTMKLFIHH